MLNLRMIDIPAEKTAKAIQRSIIGYSIMGLAASVITLFIINTRTNNYIRERMTLENLELREVVVKNNQILLDMKILFITNQELKYQIDRQEGERKATEYLDSVKAK